MRSIENKRLSNEGVAFLRDPLMYEILYEIAASVGATPEEYLLRFESVLSESPEAIMSIFEK